MGHKIVVWRMVLIFVHFLMKSTISQLRTWFALPFHMNHPVEYSRNRCSITDFHNCFHCFYTNTNNSHTKDHENGYLIFLGSSGMTSIIENECVKLTLRTWSKKTGVWNRWYLEVHFRARAKLISRAMI